MAADHVHRARPVPSALDPPAGAGLAVGPGSERKADHLRLALGGDVAATTTTGFEALRVRAVALPERDLADVDLAVEAWGRRLAAPLLVSCMTGGTSQAGPVNAALAVAAQEHRVALGLGSGRVLLDGEAGVEDGFAVRGLAPDVPILANLGAVTLHRHGPSGCARLVEVCDADALVLHCNAVQEAVQPGGDTDFGGLLARIAEVCASLEVPVVVKEVGFGLAAADVRRLVEAGVAGVDVAGAGGTNWARLEGLRDGRAGRVAAAFADWGTPTAEAVVVARRVLDETGRGDARSGGVLLIASGGLRDGVDALKALCLGADLAGMARGLLAAAADGPEAASDAVDAWVAQLRIAAWAAGAGSPAELVPDLLVARR